MPDMLSEIPLNLPAVSQARLPAVYENAKTALAECSRIDECQSWADKAEALASYAKQAGDDTLRKMADRIQARAIRRCGELLKAIQPGKTGPKPELQEGALPQLNRTQAAEEAGLSEWQRKTALRVGNIPQEVFEAQIESPSPPTVTKLAELGKQAQVMTPHYDLEGIDPAHFARATTLMGSLKRLAEFCEQNDPIDMAKAFKAHERPLIKSHLAVIESWLDRFVINIEV